MPDELNVMTGMTCFNTIDTYSIPIRRVARTTPVEVMHGKACVRRDLVKTLPVRYSFLHSVQVVENLISYK